MAFLAALVWLPALAAVDRPALSSANGRPDKPSVLSVEQQGVVDEFGPPESFQLILTRNDGTAPSSRIETWNYYRLQTRLTFVDGALRGGEEIEDLPDWTLLPAAYRPEQFSGVMDLEEVKRSIFHGRPYETLEVSDDVLPGVRLEVIGFEQLVLGFEQGRLIYVETVPLYPNVAGAGGEGEERQ